MKQILFAIALMTLAAPASAQFGSLGDAAKKATQAKNAVDDFNITDAEERQIGVFDPQVGKGWPGRI